MPEVVEWIDPAGAVTTLKVDWDTTNRFSPPTVFEESEVPGADGAQLDGVRHGPRDVPYALWIDGDDEGDLRTRMRALASSMNPQRGDGLIRVTSPLGDQREMVCRVASGLQMPERLNETSGPTVQRAVVVFRAHQPYWQDVSDTVSGPWHVDEHPGSFFSFFPMRLAASEIFAAVTVVNAGDVRTWPVWTITGPAEDVGMLNLTTGKTLRLSYDVAAGEVLTIDTRPRRKRLTSTVAGRVYGALVGPQVLWPLEPGPNAVQVELGGATPDTAVQLARRHLYLAV